MDFKLVSDYAPTGDQPEAIAQLLASIRHGSKHNTLLGVTGSGKTFTVANVISQLNRPTLVLSHNKTLAAQLYGEFKNFFPENAVEYFVSYYDYYQPEAYLPSTDTYIEKDLSINDEIEKMRLSTTATLLSGRRDVIVVSSVSCLYGCGNPSDFHSMAIHIEVGEILNYKQFLYKLVEALYTRTERELTPATFRVTGDTIDIMAAFGEFGNQCFRVTFFDNEVESIQSIDPVTGQRIQTLDALTLYPVSLFVTTKERIHTAVQQIYLDLGKQIAFFEQAGRPAEAQRIKQRVEYDLEMIKELGYCPGIENYSRYFDGRAEGTRPFCLLDYFPQDYLMVIDESHVTLPQVHAMFGGDRARKENLVEYGFRLPAAKDNRPLRFEEFEQLVGTTIYVSATPADYELMKSEGVIVEQLIRPTGLVDPPLEVRITDNQIDDLLEEIDKRVRNDDKILVTTITKRMAEELSKYFDRVGVRNRYIHSDIDTLERVQILEDLRAGMFDVLIGVNLLREGRKWPSWRSSMPTRRDSCATCVRSPRSRAVRRGIRTATSSSMPTTAPTRCATPSNRATAAAKNRCATTWSTKCSPGRRRKAARDRAPCWQIRFRHPSRMELSTPCPTTGRRWPQTLRRPTRPRASTRRSPGPGKRWSVRPSRWTFWPPRNSATACTNCKN